MPPGLAFKGHFLEKTATLRAARGGRPSTAKRLFHANSAFRRSPDHGRLTVEKGEEWQEGARIDEGDVWRRRRAGIDKLMRKRRVVLT